MNLINLFSYTVRKPLIYLVRFENKPYWGTPLSVPPLSIPIPSHISGFICLAPSPIVYLR